MNIFKNSLPVLFSIAVLSACDDDTGTIGIYPETDGLTHSHAIVNVATRSIGLGAVRTASDINYLGDIIDPETETRIRSEFAAQFHTFENYKFPEKSQMFPVDTTLAIPEDHSQDSVFCDSVEIRLYFENYYGDGDNPMKLEVYPLSKHNILSEDSVYYSDIDLTKYIDAGTKPIATKVFAPNDYTLSDSELNSSTHSNNIRIVLPNKWGTQLMQAYYENPDNFKDSYSFIRNVCPGFYFKLKSGSGNMISVDVGTINVYFTYYDKVRPDSTLSGMARFASTPEVIQSTRFVNDDLQQLIDDENCTYLKTPAGIGTEVTLPVKEIMAGHEKDSLSKARLILTRYNKKEDNYTLGTPGHVLLVRKQDMKSFFENKQVSNSLTSYTTAFDATYNTYTFENICRLVSYIQAEKKEGMRSENLSESQWEAKYPEWNKCVVIPVKRSTTQDSYGNVYETSVTHDMDMNSVRLIGGKNAPLQMQVIYSRFK